MFGEISILSPLTLFIYWSDPKTCFPILFPVSVLLPLFLIFLKSSLLTPNIPSMYWFSDLLNVAYVEKLYESISTEVPELPTSTSSWV